MPTRAMKWEAVSHVAGNIPRLVRRPANRSEAVKRAYGEGHVATTPGRRRKVCGVRPHRSQWFCCESCDITIQYTLIALFSLGVTVECLHACVCVCV